MRLTRLAVLLLGVAATAPVSAQADSVAASRIPSHPPEVAFVEEGSLGSVFRRTEGSLRLYTSDKDPAGISRCEGGCASAWPPLYAPSDAVPVGDWTLVTRDSGKRQWAYRGKPVYTRFHDSPETATGDGIPGWRLIEHTPTPATP